MLHPEDIHGASAESDDTVIMIGDALRQKYASNALAVAKLQQKLATDETLAKWDEIVAYLKG